MPSRSRLSDSTAAQRPSGSAASAKIPEYQELEHPLTPLCQNALLRLKQTHQLTNLHNHHKFANEALSQCAYEIHTALLDQQDAYRRKQQAVENRGEVMDEQTQTDLEEFRIKVTKMTERMEEQVRKTCDGQQYIKDIEAALQIAQQKASRGEARTQQTAQQQSFDPTLPGATKSTMQDTQIGAGPSVVFNEQVQSKRDQYQTFSLHNRYAAHNEYIAFKRSVHDAMYPNGEVPIPNASRWFPDVGSPAPGTAAAVATNQSDSDDDIAISREKISTKCPLTLREFEDPVTSKICPHTFEKSAIMDMIRTAPRESAGRVQCPVPGCTSELTQASLAEDHILLRKIRRLQKSRLAAREDPDSDEEVAAPGKDSRTSILLVSSAAAGGDEFDSTMLEEEDMVPRSERLETRKRRKVE